MTNSHKKHEMTKETLGMQVQQRRFIMIGAAIAFVCIALGAFGAHAFEDKLSEAGQRQYELAIRYGFIHAFAIIMLGLSMPVAQSIARIVIAMRFFLAGVLLFSGSLLILSFTQKPIIAMMIPLGGLSFLIGWGFYFLAMWKAP